MSEIVRKYVVKFRTYYQEAHYLDRARSFDLNDRHFLFFKKCMYYVSNI